MKYRSFIPMKEPGKLFILVNPIVRKGKESFVYKAIPN